MRECKDKVANRKRDSPARQNTRNPRRLLDRILETPHLAHVVPQLQPEVLHKIVQSCGLEDCGEIVALATPGQLARVFDLDLWRAGEPGLDEQFDADRFGVWLEVLVESDATSAAQIVARMNIDTVVAGVAQHALVFDRAVVSPMVSMDGEEAGATGVLHDGISCDVGGYMVVATRTDSWDAIVAVLMSLDAKHPDYFHRVMGGCRALSNSGHEVDGLDELLADREQDLFDLAFDRERRREAHGFVPPAQARAFLQASRHVPLGDATTPPYSPITRAYFRGIEWTDVVGANSEANPSIAGSDIPPPPDDRHDAIAAIVDLLLDAGVLPQQPRARIEAAHGHSPRLEHIHRQMQFVHDSDHAAHLVRSQELAYLANTIVAGCSIQARPITAQEASDAAVAACNLGLENWPRRWLGAETLPQDFLVGHDLVSVFQVGWTILYEDVCMYAADQLVGVLSGLRCDDRETRDGLDALRVEMASQRRSGAPWRARDALDVIAILDMPAWATLLGLIDECPIIHAAMDASRDSRKRAVSASAFEFISDNRQIASIREFMRSLPEALRSGS